MVTSLFKSTVSSWGKELQVQRERKVKEFFCAAGIEYDMCLPSEGVGAKQTRNQQALWLFPFQVWIHSVFFLYLFCVLHDPSTFLSTLSPFSARYTGWQVVLWEVERARAAFSDCRTESWDSTAFSWNTECSRNGEATESHGQPWPQYVSGDQKKPQICWATPTCTYMSLYSGAFCSQWSRQSRT